MHPVLSSKSFFLGGNPPVLHFQECGRIACIPDVESVSDLIRSAKELILVSLVTRQ